MAVRKSFFNAYGPWALVTGASSGIGEQFARILAAEGFSLIIVARREDRLKSLAVELREKHKVEIDPLALDLSTEDFISVLISTCEGKDIGLVISNAGFGIKGLHHENSQEKLSEMLSLNCRTPLMLTHTFIPRLIKRGQGGIILTGSMEGFFGVPWSAGYSATKAFVLSLGEALWGELKKHKIDVLVLAPGATDTETHDGQGIAKEDLVGLKPPEDVARAALEKLGKKSVYVTGFFNRVYIGLCSVLPRQWAVTSIGTGVRNVVLKNRNRREIS